MTEWVECYTWDRMVASTRAEPRGVVYGGGGGGGAPKSEGFNRIAQAASGVRV